MLKIIQLYEISLVRHGFMLVGPTMCGKSRIMQTLTQGMSEDPEKPTPHKLVVMNPKAITEAWRDGSSTQPPWVRACVRLASERPRGFNYSTLIMYPFVKVFGIGLGGLSLNTFSRGGRSRQVFFSSLIMSAHSVNFRASRLDFTHVKGQV